MERQRSCRRYSTAVTKSQKLRKTFTLCCQLLRGINFLLKHLMFYCRKLKPLRKYFIYRFIFTDKDCCLRLFGISRNFLIKTSIEQELYIPEYPYLLFWSALFTFFEYSEVPYLLTTCELIHFLLWS